MVAVTPASLVRGHFAARRIVKPSPQQFETLALEQLDMLYRVARRLTRDSAAAEDLVQETYVRALRGRDSFDLKTHGIRPWLLRIMHNLHVSRGEREARQPTALADNHLEAATALSQSCPPPWDRNSFDGM